MNSTSPFRDGRTLGIDFSSARGFLWRFVLLLAFLLAPWPGVGRVFSGAFTSVAALVTPATLGERVELEFGRGPGSPWESVLFARDRVTSARIHVPIESRSLAYVPLAVFLSLALATPISAPERRREYVVLFGGLATMLLLIALLTALPVLGLLGGGSPVRAFELGRGTLLVLDLVQRIFVAPPAMTYVLPALVWGGFLVATRRAR